LPARTTKYKTGEGISELIALFAVCIIGDGGLFIKSGEAPE